jgi:hypothetical protein
MGAGLVIVKPVSPIFVIEGLDVGVYASVQDAMLHLEPIDVADKIYKGFDAEGRKLKIETDGVKVLIFTDEQEPVHANELEALLRDFLKAKSEAAGSDSTCNLPSLVEVCKKFTYVPPKTFREAVKGLFNRQRTK